MFRGAVYLRVGDGNKLVRSSKAASPVGVTQMSKWTPPTRTPVHIAMLALSNARYRWKKPHCQVFTRSGNSDKIMGNDQSTSGEMQAGVLTGAVYFRIGVGNKLVRLSKPPAAVIQKVKQAEVIRKVNPAAVIQKLKWFRSTRCPAVQKAKWTLRNRTYLRRKQYCQFFTRFGKCDKSDGNCPFIHDAEKVAVCTQFLKGTCRDKSCLLTHRAIPERMPDCIYFLQGVCTSDPCPYRHVKVNSKASICINFLKGHCPDGDNCNYKHTYVCPVYAEIGHCPEQETCKLHHPRRKGHIGFKRNRRQFGCDSSSLCEVERLFKRSRFFPEPQQSCLQDFLARVQDGTSDMERLIKPAFLLPR